MTEKYLVTPALPYANGPIHLGHLVEHVQVNLFVRALRMAKKDVLYVCGADSHGTPIEMNALKAKVSPKEFAASWQKHQEKSFTDFDIEFDGGYGSTHTNENEQHAQKIFSALKDQGFISTREIEQLFDPQLKRFLPDRMVLGTCPKCKSPNQYGDSCEACGRTYQTTDLIEPRSALSGASPVLKKSTHYFVSLKDFETRLKDWIKTPGVIHSDTQAFLNHWFEEGLKDWDISRDGPYFGFKIPGEEDKYFYVWLDAPIGYISLCEKAAKEKGLSLKDYWQSPDAKIYHFIGKDIVYFHTLFWPAMLMAAKYTLPEQIVVHGMLTVNGEKMSKSRGTFILADTFKKHVDPEALRYYYACKLSNRTEDIDLNLEDFAQRVNTDLVNKVVNLISRSLPLIHRFFDKKAASLDTNAQELIDKASQITASVQKYYLENEPAKALNEIIRFSEDANKYLQDKAPWKLAKSDPKLAHQVLTTGLYVGKICFALLKPVLPKAVKKLENILGLEEEINFANLAQKFPEGHEFGEYEHLFTRIDNKNIQKMLDESKEAQKGVAVAKTDSKSSANNSSDFIDIKQFAQVDLRAAKILSASEVEGSDKLIACQMDVGELGKRQIFAGLREFLSPSDLEGKTVVIVANLAPRKMRFGVSEGMILACGEKNPQPLFVNSLPGEKVG